MRNGIYGVVYRSQRPGPGIKYWNEVAIYESLERACRHRQRLINNPHNIYTDKNLTVKMRGIRFGEGNYV